MSLSRFGKALLLTNRSHETFAEQAPLRYIMPLQDNLPKRVLHKLNVGAWGVPTTRGTTMKQRGFLKTKTAEHSDDMFPRNNKGNIDGTIPMVTLVLP
jgi:hypothetical protein